MPCQFNNEDRASRTAPLSPSTVKGSLFSPPRIHHLAAGDLLDSSPPSAAPAAGGRGIGRSRRVYSVGSCRALAGGAVEKMVSPEKLLWMQVFFSVLSLLREARGGSAVRGVVAAPRSFDAPSLKPACVMASPEFEDLDEGDDVDQDVAAHRAGWRHSAEDRRLPCRLRAPPSPTFDGGVAA